MRIAIFIALWSILSVALPATAQEPPPATAQVPEALIPPSTNLLAHSLSAKEAGPAWDELQEASRPPHPPAQWQIKEPTEKEQSDFFLPYALALADKSKDYYTRFPKDSHAADARKQEFEITGVAIRLGDTNLQSRLDAEEKVLLADPALSEDDRFDIRHNDVERAAAAKESDGEAAATAEYEKGARALQKEFPKRPEIMDMLLQVALNSEEQKARALLREITGTNSAASDEIKASAASRLKQLDAIGKPVAMQFAAVDGRAVDVAKLKGKVVLVDFWATWCVPCVGEVPHVKAAYDQFHAKGLEIVGVSLDREKESLTQFIAEHKMEWPQYFDGQEEENKFARQFGVETIPALWLIDKQGNLRDINAHSGLSAKVEKLLAE
jgi:peroxiredoxin